MNSNIARRRLLQAATAGVGAAAWPGGQAARAAEATKLNVIRRILEVNGKPAPVFGLVQANGESGIALDPGQRFLVDVVNQIGEDTILHWHGQTPPNNQDGVALTGVEPLIAAATTRRYDYAPRPGTHWMHSHHGMQEMQLMAAPLVVRSAEDLRLDAQEVVMILHDFTFRAPEEVMASLTGGSMAGMAMPGAAPAGQAASPPAAASPMAGMAMPGAPASSGSTMPGMAMGVQAVLPPSTAATKPAEGGMKMGDATKPDLNDFDFDAYLANDRTLDDPEVVRTERGGRVRLRVINAAASTAFWLELGAVEGIVVAVDGEPVRPVTGRRGAAPRHHDRCQAGHRGADPCPTRGRPGAHRHRAGGARSRGRQAVRDG